MELKAEHVIEDEEWAALKEALSGAQTEHQKAEDKKILQYVPNCMVHKHTSFDFAKVHLMLHSAELIQRFGHLVKGSTEAQQMDDSIMRIGPDCRMNRNIPYQWQILNNYFCIHD